MFFSFYVEISKIKWLCNKAAPSAVLHPVSRTSAHETAGHCKDRLIEIAA
jgi:hypothetical protein